MCRLELWFLILSLDGDLASHGLLWVLLVDWELGQRLVIALLGRV